MDVSSEKPPVPYDVRSLPAIYLRDFNVASTPILFESDGLFVVRAVQWATAPIDTYRPGSRAATVHWSNAVAAPRIVCR